jgi:hypothetical protein
MAIKTPKARKRNHPCIWFSAKANPENTAAKKT